MTAALLSLCLLVARPALAAPADDFYVNLLHRGMSHVEAGMYEPAVRELQIAAFGTVNSIQQFELSEVYLTIALERIGRHDEARRAVVRLVAAEKVERHYSRLSIPARSRAEFEAIAARMLPADQLAILHQPVAAPAAVAAPTPALAEGDDVSHTIAAADVPALLDTADRALASGNRTAAAATYRSLAGLSGLDHATLLRIGRGAVLTNDYASAVAAFARIDPFAAGEESYRFDYAVALYETGAYARAKRELMAALPALEPTATVQAYRARIEHGGE